MTVESNGVSYGVYVSGNSTVDNVTCENASHNDYCWGIYLNNPNAVAKNCKVANYTESSSEPSVGIYGSRVYNCNVAPGNNQSEQIIGIEIPEDTNRDFFVIKDNRIDGNAQTSYYGIYHNLVSVGSSAGQISGNTIAGYGYNVRGISLNTDGSGSIPRVMIEGNHIKVLSDSSGYGIYAYHPADIIGNYIEITASSGRAYGIGVFAWFAAVNNNINAYSMSTQAYSIMYDGEARGITSGNTINVSGSSCFALYNRNATLTNAQITNNDLTPTTLNGGYAYTTNGTASATIPGSATVITRNSTTNLVCGFNLV
jgi:hypothetical protein